ncbi:MAG: hypothetical protein IJ448_01795 [Oscillospiraceae bacterium]|nr:hypothetical protein [Oscillospiraceae bacterium]
MKKANFEQKLICILFCGFLAVMTVLMFFLPKADFSELEKRELASSPVLNWESLTSGQFGEDAETFMADHMPGRNFFVGLNAYFELLTGRQITKDYYLSGDRLFTAPVEWNQAQIDLNLKYINKFAAAQNQPVDLILVPSAGFIIGDTGFSKPYLDGEYIDAIYGLTDENIRCVDLVSLFKAEADPDSLYYRTDHHWTSYGAYLAAAGYMGSLGRDFPAKEAFSVETAQDFRGSAYSSAGLWLVKGEPIEMWSTGAPIKVEASTAPDVVHDGVFYTEKLQEADKYTVFLGGNQPLVRLKNENNAGKGKILVIRDSYANCMGPFLAESYAEVVMMDLRYFKTTTASKLIEQEGFDEILICYSIGNFMTDKNFTFLR